MVSKHKIHFWRFKTTTALTLALFLSCLSINADGFYFDSEEIPSTRYAKSIYLDTSRTEKVLNSNTSIPFNLRSFSEEEYFTSSIDDAPKINQNSPPEFVIGDIPTPSEYKPVSRIDKIAEQEIPELRAEEKTFAPTGVANSFFAPISEPQKEQQIVQEDAKPIEPFKVLEEVNEGRSYFATATSVDSSADIDLEGRVISEISFSGLKTVNKQTVLDCIKTKRGGVFNQEIVQVDLQNIYATGYFSDNMAVEPIVNPDGTVKLTFSLEENIIVSDVKIIGNEVISTKELMPFISPLKGYPQNLKKINSAIENLLGYYHEKGYILANISSVDDNSDGILSFSILEGVINKIKFSGNEKTKDYVIQRNIMTQPGTVYNEEFLKKDLAKVFSTQIFDEVNRDLTPSEENPGTFDVTVVVKEKSTNSIALGGGIDTGLGAFGSISLREDNFLGKAQKVSLSGILGSGILLSDASIKNHMNYQVELSFFEPYFINADNSLMSKIYYREMGSWNIPLAIERRIGANIGVEHKVRDFDHLYTNFTLGAEHISLKEGDFNRIESLYKQHGLNISERAKQLSDGFFLNLSPGIRYSNVDSIENPREGIMAQARFTEAIGVNDFNQTNGRLSGAITKFFPVFKKSSFSLTAKAGIKVHGDDMPEVMAYRLGGPYTIRGFRINGVGTGDSFLMGTAELATPLPFVDRLKWDVFKKMRLTFFVDAGKVFDPTISNILYDRPLHAISAGIGLRLYVPGMGPVSVDYGLPLLNPGDSGSEHGYFTFGTGGMNMYGNGY